MILKIFILFADDDFLDVNDHGFISKHQPEMMNSIHSFVSNLQKTDLQVNNTKDDQFKISSDNTERISDSVLAKLEKRLNKNYHELCKYIHSEGNGTDISQHCQIKIKSTENFFIRIHYLEMYQYLFLQIYSLTKSEMPIVFFNEKEVAQIIYCRLYDFFQDKCRILKTLIRNILDEKFNLFFFEYYLDNFEKLFRKKNEVDCIDSENKIDKSIKNVSQEINKLGIENFAKEKISLSEIFPFQIQIFADFIKKFLNLCYVEVYDDKGNIFLTFYGNIEAKHCMFFRFHELYKSQAIFATQTITILPCLNGHYIMTKSTFFSDLTFFLSYFQQDTVFLDLTGVFNSILENLFFIYDSLVLELDEFLQKLVQMQNIFIRIEDYSITPGKKSHFISSKTFSKYKCDLLMEDWCFKIIFAAKFCKIYRKISHVNRLINCYLAANTRISSHIRKLENMKIIQFVAENKRTQFNTLIKKLNINQNISNEILLVSNGIVNLNEQNSLKGTDLMNNYHLLARFNQIHINSNKKITIFISKNLIVISMFINNRYASQHDINSLRQNSKFDYSDHKTHINDLREFTVKNTKISISFLKLFNIHSEKPNNFVRYSNLDNRREICFKKCDLKFRNQSIKLFHLVEIDDCTVYSFSNIIEFKNSINHHSQLSIKNTKFEKNPCIQGSMDSIYINQCFSNFKLNYEQISYLEIVKHIGVININDCIHMQSDKKSKFVYQSNLSENYSATNKFVFSNIIFTSTLILNCFEHKISFEKCIFQKNIEFIIFQEHKDEILNIFDILNVDNTLDLFFVKLDICNGKITNCQRK